MSRIPDDPRRAPTDRHRVPWPTRHRDWIALAAVLVAVLAAIPAYLALRGEDRASPGAVGGRSAPLVDPNEPPKSIIEQIAQRDIWIRSPKTFESASDRENSGNGDTGLADSIIGPSVVDSRDLVDNAVLYEDDFVFLVGRVVRIRSLEDTFGVDTEYQLATVRGTDAYVAASFPGHPILSLLSDPVEGDVVYAGGKIAAVGEARSAPGEPVRSAVYFVTDEDVGIEKYERGRPVDSATLQRALNAISSKP
jgi:hypothetical protein